MLALLGAGAAAVSAFAFAQLPGLIGEWRFDQGSGVQIHNDAIGERTSDPNLVRSPEGQFSTTMYGKTGSPVVTDNYAASPWGDTSATRIQFSAAAAGATRVRDAEIRPAAGQHTISCYIKSTGGSDQAVRLDCGTTTSSDLTVTSSWQRFTFTFTATTSSRAGIINASTGAAADVLVIGLDLRPGASAGTYIRPDGRLRPFKPATPATWVSGGVSVGGAAAEQAFMGQFAAAVSMDAGTVHFAVACTTAASEGNDPLLQVGWSNSTKGRIGLRNSSHAQVITIGGQTAADDSGDNTNSLVPLTPFGAGVHVWSVAWGGGTCRTSVDGMTIRETALTPASVSDTLFGLLTNLGSFYAEMTAHYALWYTAKHSESDVRRAVAKILSTLAERGLAVAPSAIGPVDLMIGEGDSTGVAGGTVGFLAYAAAGVSRPLVGIQAATSGATSIKVEQRIDDIVALYHPDRRNNIVVLSIGINDLNSDTANVATIFARMQSIGLAYKAAGFLVCATTVTPTTLVTAGGFNTQRGQLNTLIRGDDSWYDALADFAADATMGPDAAANDNTLYGDGIHPTAVGMTTLGGILAAAVETLVA